MANSLALPPSATNTQRWLKASGVALVLLLVVAAVGSLWLWTQRGARARATIQPNLLALIEADQISPRLPLLVLADYPPEQVMQEPIQQSDWNDALAIWLFGPLQSDRASLEMLLTLAEAETATHPDQTASLLFAAADLVRISPEMTDRERADFLVRIGEQMADLGLNGAAAEEWEQVSLIAHYSPSLQPMYRATVLQTLANLYRWTGDGARATAAREAAAQVGATGVLQPAAEPIFFETAAPPTPPAALLAARDQRRIAALQVGLALDGGTAEGAYADLRAALLTEGTLQRAWVAEQQQAELPNPVRAALLLEHIQWLQRERMLTLGLGGPAFTVWGTRRVEIEAELGEAWNMLDQVRLAQGIENGARDHATLAHRAWWAERLVQVRLGRDPGLQIAMILNSMRPNNADDAGGASLRLDWVNGRFWQIPREWVGRDTLPD